MNRISLFALAAFLLPSIAFAQGVQRLLATLLDFFNNTLVPLIIALAFLFFLINAVRYFIIGGTDEEGRKKARGLATWGILAFFIMVSIWGIVNLFTYTFGIGRDNVVCPDYFPNCTNESEHFFQYNE